MAAFGRAPADAEPAELSLVQPDGARGAGEPRSAGEHRRRGERAPLIVMASLLVIAAIVFALVALLGV